MPAGDLDMEESKVKNLKIFHHGMLPRIGTENGNKELYLMFLSVLIRVYPW